MATKAKTSAPPPIGAIFSRELWGITLRTIMLTGIALTTVWAFWFFLPHAIRQMPEVKGWDHGRVEAGA